MEECIELQKISFKTATFYLFQLKGCEQFEVTKFVAMSINYIIHPDL
jgi:hypothetical protein